MALYEGDKGEYIWKMGLPFAFLYFTYFDFMHPIFVHAYDAYSESRRVRNENHDSFKSWYNVSLGVFFISASFIGGAFKITLMQTNWVILVFNSLFLVP